MKTETRIRLVALATALIMIALCAFIYRLIQEDQSHTIRVGYIYQGDASTPYDRNFIEAQTAIEQTYGDKVESVVFYNVREKNLESIHDEVIAADCDMIIANSYGYQTVIKKWAEENPDIQFVMATGDNANTEPILDNYHTAMGTIHEGRYIAGVVAGAKLKEMIDSGEVKASDAKIGYVGAYPYSEIISGFTAFFMGVYSQVPEVTMDVIYVNSWSDYNKEKKAARQLIESGAVIISQHSDTIGPATVCQEMSDEYNIIHVGYNGSMIDVAPTTSLISSKINWIPYEVAAVGAVLNGQRIEDRASCFSYGNDCWAGISKGWVKIIGINEFIAPEGVHELISETIKGLSSGKIEIFSGPFTATDSVNITKRTDLSKEVFHENNQRSAPSFNYILDDVIKIVDLK